MCAKRYLGIRFHKCDCEPLCRKTQILVLIHLITSNKKNIAICFKFKWLTLVFELNIKQRMFYTICHIHCHNCNIMCKALRMITNWFRFSTEFFFIALLLLVQVIFKLNFRKYKSESLSIIFKQGKIIFQISVYFENLIP